MGFARSLILVPLAAVSAFAQTVGSQGARAVAAAPSVPASFLSAVPSAPSFSLAAGLSAPSLPVSAIPSAVSVQAPAAAAAAAPALAALPAAAEPPSAAPARVPAAAPAGTENKPDLVSLRMPNGRTVVLARGVLNENRGLELSGEGPDGLLLDLGPSETAIGVDARDITGKPSDWVLLSHDGRVSSVRANRGGARSGLVGGAARSVIVVSAGRARELGLARGRAVPQLGEGSSVIEVEQAFESGEFTPAELADSLSRNGASEPRFFLDALVARLDASIKRGGEDGEKAERLRSEVLLAVARAPEADGNLRMQAATVLFLDTMPRALLRFNKDWPRKVSTLYRWSDIWIHETGHQLVAAAVGAPAMEKRVFAHGAGFIAATPGAGKARRVAIDLAGGTAEVVVGGSAAAAGVAAILSAPGFWAVAAGLLAAPFIVLGLHMVLTSVAHASNDLEHVFGVLGWKKAESFMREAIAEAGRDAAKAARGVTVPAFVFYRAAARTLAAKLRSGR